MGLGPLPGMGHQLPAAAAQLHLPAPDPLRIARLRPAPPEVALGEYEANKTDDGQLINAGEETGRVEELQARITGESENPNEAT